MENTNYLVNDIQVLEEAKRQKLKMLEVLEQNILDKEDDYLEKSLSRNGNVFNAWKEIKQWNNQAGIGAGPGGGTKKRQNKANDKVVQKEQRFRPMIMYEREKREEFEKDFKINYVELAKRKIEQGDSALRPLNVQHTSSKRPSRGKQQAQDSTINSGALPGSKESVGKSGLGQNPGNASSNSKSTRGGQSSQKNKTIQISQNNSKSSASQAQNLSVVATSSNNQSSTAVRSSGRLKKKNNNVSISEPPQVTAVKADSQSSSPSKSVQKRGQNNEQKNAVVLQDLQKQLANDIVIEENSLTKENIPSSKIQTPKQKRSIHNSQNTKHEPATAPEAEQEKNKAAPQKSPMKKTKSQVNLSEQQSNAPMEPEESHIASQQAKEDQDAKEPSISQHEEAPEENQEMQENDSVNPEEAAQTKVAEEDKDEEPMEDQPSSNPAE